MSYVMLRLLLLPQKIDANARGAREEPAFNCLWKQRWTQTWLGIVGPSRVIYPGRIAMTLGKACRPTIACWCPASF